MAGTSPDAEQPDTADGAPHGGALWPRPVPLIGDQSSAQTRAAAPGAWAFPADDRQALYDVIGARRDIRRFLADPVPDAALKACAGRSPRRPIGRALPTLALRRRPGPGDPGAGGAHGRP